MMGLDGHTWKIEGCRNGRYHSAECWSPEEGPFFDLGQLLLDLARIDPPPAAP
jgi:hypothetical protein